MKTIGLNFMNVSKIIKQKILIDCINDKKLIRRLKEMLMRMK
jgi:hypothetical protein